MKIYICILLIVFLFSCSDKKEIRIQYIGNVELEYNNFDEYHLDSLKILYPTGIHSFKKHLLLIEPKNNPTISFWSMDNLEYEFSSGYKGSGPGELIHPRADYFTVSDSSFYLLDSNIEREMIISNDSVIHNISNIPILIPDAINQMVHLDNCYIMSGLTSGKSKEHLMYRQGEEFTEFGDYVNDEHLLNEELAIYNYKFIAGIKGHNKIFDFYQYRNLIRCYDIEGNLIEEIQLGGIPERNNSFDKLQDGTIQPYRGYLFVTDDYIYSLYYENIINSQLYAEEIIPELQIWDWNGNLIRRIRFNHSFSRFTVANGRIYALNTRQPYRIYVSEIGK